MSRYNKMRSFALTEQELENLETSSERFNVSQSQIIRKALHDFFEKMGLPVVKMWTD